MQAQPRQSFGPLYVACPRRRYDGRMLRRGRAEAVIREGTAAYFANFMGRVNV